MLNAIKLPKTIHVPQEIDKKVLPRQRKIIAAYNSGGISKVRWYFGYSSGEQAHRAVVRVMVHIEAMSRIGVIPDPEENLKSPDVDKAFPRPVADKVLPVRQKSMMAIFDEVLSVVARECELPENEVVTFLQRSSKEISSAAGLCMYLACKVYNVPIDRVAKQFRCDENKAVQKIKSIEILIMREDRQIMRLLESTKSKINIWL